MPKQSDRPPQTNPPSRTYPAAAATFNDEADPLAVPLANFERHFAINATSAFMAAKHAALAFAALPASAARTFVYTGNRTNVAPLASLLDCGVGKAAAAHVVQVAAEAYRDRGFKCVTPVCPSFLLLTSDSYRTQC